MLMLEHDAKELLAAHGLPVPRGLLVDAATCDPSSAAGFGPPYVVKAQVPVGGRGKAGGVRVVQDPADLRPAVASMSRLRIRGHEVRECRVEESVANAREVYLSLSVDPETASVRMLVSERGGVDIEFVGGDHIRSETVPADVPSLSLAAARLAAGLPEPVGAALADAAARVAALFVELDAMLVEINPLFVRPDGSWVAGDAKIILDDNAMPRQAWMSELVERRAHAYPEVAFKRDQGFDFVLLDPDGGIGLVTTGAGLSMKLVDDLKAAGVGAYNFCDVRSGGMRGDPARLIHLLERMAEGRGIRAVLVNIFAGITDLGEFAELLVIALRSVPDLDTPVIARLVGNGEAKAAEILRGSGLPVTIEPDLEHAVALATALSRGRDA